MISWRYYKSSALCIIDDYVQFLTSKNQEFKISYISVKQVIQIRQERNWKSSSNEGENQQSFREILFEFMQLLLR